jgi:hypothetical protein
MALRAGHGDGAGVPRVEVLPPDELPTPNAHDTAAALAIRSARGRPFAVGNRAAAGRRPRLAQLGVPTTSSDPRYALALRRAARYRKRRCAELAVVWGGYLSAGAASMIASASLALCASRYLYELAAETGDPATLKQASALAIDARQTESAAWELASREGKARLAQALYVTAEPHPADDSDLLPEWVRKRVQPADVVDEPETEEDETDADSAG